MLNEKVIVTVNTVMGAKMIEGTVYDMTPNGKFIHVENTEDYYCFELERVTVEIVKNEQPEEVKPVAETVRHMDLKAINKEIERLTKYNEAVQIYVNCYNYDEDYEFGYDVEVVVEFEDDFEYITVDTFGTEAQANRRLAFLARKLGVENKGIYTC